MTRYLTLVAAAAVLFLPACGDHSHEGDRGSGSAHEAATRARSDRRSP